LNAVQMSPRARWHLSSPDLHGYRRCRIDDGTIKDQRSWEPFRPERSRRIDCRHVPQRATARAASRFSLSRIALASQLPGDKMIRVPKVDRSRICQASQHRRPWLREVHEENRLPHCEHSDPRVGVTLEDFLDCGDPPQACRSGRREEQNDSDRILCSIEFVLEAGDRYGVEESKPGSRGGTARGGAGCSDARYELRKQQ
jgi:hypothetical protein